jgi:hypothetical protein
MSRASPLFIIPALKVNRESRMVVWQSVFCGSSRIKNNAMAWDLGNIKPLGVNIFHSLSYFLERW